MTANLNKKNIEDILSLSAMQEGMLFYYLKERDRGEYFEQLCLNISGNLNLCNCQTAWKAVVNANEMLRTVFRWENIEKPIQIILKDHDPEIEICDLSEEVDIEHSLQKIKLTDRQELFDLSQVPFRVKLCKLTEDHFVLIVSNHHILFDGWSTGIILKEFITNYTRLSEGKPVNQPTKTKFKEFLKQYNNQDKNEQRGYWQEYLKGFDANTYLTRTGDLSWGQASTYKYIFSQKFFEDLNDLTRTYKITLATILYTAWGILLQRYTNSDDVVFGTTISGRDIDLEGIEEMVGLFINTLPLRVQTVQDEKNIQLLQRVNSGLKNRAKYHKTSLAEIKEACNTQRFDLFDSIVVIENYPLDSILTTDAGLISIDSYSMHETTNVGLILEVMIHDTLNLSLSYFPSRYSREMIQDMVKYFERILGEFVNHPENLVKNIDVLTKMERRAFFEVFNATEAYYPKEKKIHQLFEEEVEKNASKIALIFGEEYVTYGELNQRANQLARFMRKKGVKPDTVVGIRLARRPELIISILGVLKAGGAYLPIDLQYPQKRVEYMLKDSGVNLLITQLDSMDQIAFEGTIIHLQDHEIANESARNLDYKVNHDNLAYIIYTSGSTNHPKGVMIGHRSLVNYIFWASQQYVKNEFVKFPLFTSISFDLTITSIFTPLGSGNCIVIYEDSCKAVLMEEVLKDNQVDVIKLTPAHLRVVLELDCSQLKVKRFIVGGEQLDTDLALQISQKFNHNIEIFNEYGPTEATVGCMIYQYNPLEDKRLAVPIGVPIHNTRIYLLDVYGNPVVENAVGEVYIGGCGLAHGYFNQPELSQEVFVENPLNPEERVYRTGDLAKWLPDGKIEFIGRKDEQIKIRGYRIEPGEITSQLLQHPSIKDVVTVVKERDNEKYVCAYIVGSDFVAPQELKAYLSPTLPEYMIPSYFIQMEQLPLTINGKIDKKALPDPFLGLLSPEVLQDENSSKSDNEKKLIEIVAEILNLTEDNTPLSANFFELGGHSLKAIRLRSKILKVFHTDLSISRILDSNSLKELANVIQDHLENKLVAIEPVPEKDYYETSFAQKRVWILSQFEEVSLSYNMHDRYIFEEEIDLAAFQKVFDALIEKYEVLRTVFLEVNGRIMQKVLPPFEVTFRFDLIDLSTQEDAHEEVSQISDSEKNTPFDLATGPLFRGKLIRLASKKYVFLFTIHHIIGDLISSNVLKREVYQYYRFFQEGRGSTLKPLKIQYKDYAEWELSQLNSSKWQEHREYWMKQFTDDYQILQLPTDFPRPSMKTYNGETITFKIGQSLTNNLKDLSSTNKTTLFVTILTISKILFYFYTGDTDITLGTPVSVREHPDLEEQIGIFLNTLALRTKFLEEDSFLQVQKKVKEVVVEGIQHQSYPFDRLVEDLHFQRDISRHPFFDIMVDMIHHFDSFGETEISNFGKSLSTVECCVVGGEMLSIERSKSKFDLTIYVQEGVNEIKFEFEYNSDLFKRKTLVRMIERFKTMMESVVEDPNQSISELQIDRGIYLPSIM